MADWNSVQYLKFKNERTQPSIDLAARIELENPKKAVDIGCGPGNSTQVLAQRFPGARVLGVDSSPNMIEQARADCPELDFAVCDCSGDLGALGGDFDVVFSNACLQWIPEHARLIPSLLSLLRPGGVLAVQVPMNFDEPIHRIIGEVSESAAWKPLFPNPRIFYTLKPGDYFDLFTELGSPFTLWETTYYHVMASHADILEWYRSTGLRPYLDVLSDEKKAEFEAEVMREVVRHYPPQADGRVIFRFPRFFFLAGKPA